MNRRKATVYLLSIALVTVVAALGSWVTARGLPAYALLEKPALTPPAIVFPIVWSVLYLLMALGAGRVFLSDRRGRDSALAVYIPQLAVNLSWSFLFFGLGAYFFSFLWILLLLGLVVLMIRLFCRVDAAAGVMQLPYLLWLLLAAYLNLSIWLLNR